MRNLFSIAVVSLALVGCGGGGGGGGAQGATVATQAPTATKTPTTRGPSFRLAAWLPYWGVAQGQASLRVAIPLLDEVSPFWFSIEPDGSLRAQTNARDPAVVAQVKAAGALVIPTATRGFDPRLTPSVLTDPTLSDRAIRALVNEAVMGGYDGMDLDIEGLSEQDRQPYSTFVARAAAAMHAIGKVLSVTVQAKTSEPGKWSGQRAFDYAALGGSADRFRIMTYDYHWSGGTPGAIAPLDWIEEVGRLARALVPPERVYLGVPFYGYDWGAAGTKAKGVVWDEAMALAASRAATVRRDAATLESWFTYSDAGVTHTVWFQDADSVAAKVAVARRLGLGGATVWRLGGEAPRFWDTIRVEAGK